MPRTRPLVIGHRGAPGYRPEHSRSSYDLALRYGVDAVEPDVVVSRDGVLVVRHENEISGTTDVAERREFADRRTTKTVDGTELTGWFTEDFTWDELSTLGCRERLPRLRPGSATFDDQQPVLRLRDVLDLVRAASLEQGREIGVVLELKHATYFERLGLGLAGLVEAELREAGWADGALPLVIEAFESTVLAQLRAHSIRATYVYLLEAAGRPFDLVAAHGDQAPTYRRTATPAGLDELVGTVDGISVSKSMILGGTRGDEPPSLVADAHTRGLRVFTWTCRPENTFLSRRFRSRGGPAAFGDYEAEWELIRRSGVDGVFVDHPDIGIDLFHRVTATP
ncbi:glycerophosphodiester phosphodiesterase family protein [Microbacterium terricola]|uniref:glycerophosphodiester phosphodiesterase n=1 Tax=Microbacterium terricola TaxID=344163 RepID=A0ABM8DW43_9MICO|nr:glycerophosphodiester phosphodiesterase family protein [Microbacterium terricola]UYK39441.1 glycerophosphodiester phosphodiesterase family protein [Microbacterium terricola]BDV29832.1 glycerophosphoryl diester phosphodiesterase [Microbacterium terricola]